MIPEPENTVDSPQAKSLLVRSPEGNIFPGERLFTYDHDRNSFLIIVEPGKFSFFTDVPVPELLAHFTDATATDPKLTVLEDRYHDTPDVSLYNNGGSVRLRTYIAPAREMFFEIIWSSWSHNEAPEQNEGEYDYRKNQVIVQSFGENGIADYWEHIERYVQSGLDEKLCLMQTRHSFNLEPVSAQDIKAEQHPAFHHLGHLVPRFSRCDDIGLKVVVDELATPLMGFSTVVDIEFGRNHETRARELANQVKTEFGANLSEKEHNNIRYYLDTDGSATKDFSG